MMQIFKLHIIITVRTRIVLHQKKSIFSPTCQKCGANSLLYNDDTEKKQKSNVISLNTNKDLYPLFQPNQQLEFETVEIYSPCNLPAEVH